MLSTPEMQGPRGATAVPPRAKDSGPLPASSPPQLARYAGRSSGMKGCIPDPRRPRTPFFVQGPWPATCC